MEYPDFLSYFCMGCDPKQGTYVDTSTNKVKVCKSLADKIFTTNKKMYDNCGLSVAGSTIYPSIAYTDVTQFMNAIKPTHFQSYTFEVVDQDVDCLSAANTSAMISLVLVLLAATASIAMSHFMF